MARSPLRFIHISDTHIGTTRDYELYGCNCYSNALRIIETINGLPLLPEFVLHTGDVAAAPDEAAYQLAAEVFARLNIPIYFVTGNHDSAALIKTYLKMGEMEITSHSSFLAYTFERNGFRFIALDARGPDEIDPRGVLEEHQFDFLQGQLARDASPVAVFVHFPPLPLDSLWLNNTMLLINGERFHRMLVPHRDRLRGVFFGHVHRGMHVLQDGVLYSSVASTIGQFAAWPNDEQVRLDLHHPACFNVVTLTDQTTIIKEHVIG